MGVMDSSIRILGRKIGMTQVFLADGRVTGVTVIEAGPCLVLGVRGKNVLVGFEETKEAKVKMPQRGVFKKANLPVKRMLQELKVPDAAAYKPGDEIKVDIFKEGDFVDVIGTSIGKGFQGGMKRWHWKGTPMTHGSMSHRRIGSVGASSDPSRIFKGKTMAGHMGHDRVTVQNLKVIKVDLANNLLAVTGGVPGPKNGLLLVRKSIKKEAKAKAKAKV
jgi:large subunit ribosomal protein L3